MVYITMTAGFHSAVRRVRVEENKDRDKKFWPPDLQQNVFRVQKLEQAERGFLLC